ncbi:hypothetical protein ACLMAL_06115 [Nocardia sp. CWNU-33]|uniref:hypothetical protein n=1 Tax=Nocardia sp. CWNU-33 TaxID=3392117 RepID=UPI00398E468B
MITRGAKNPSSSTPTNIIDSQAESPTTPAAQPKPGSRPPVNQRLRRIRPIFGRYYFCRQLHWIRTPDGMRIDRFEDGEYSLYQTDSAVVGTDEGRRLRASERSV